MSRQDASVKRTLEKFTNATLLEDKRSALTELKALAIVNPEAVASMAFQIIIPILPNSRVCLFFPISSSLAGRSQSGGLLS